MINSSRKAIYLSFMTEYSTQILSFISVIILARILTPIEVGVYSVALTLVLLFQNMTAFGVGQYIVSEKTLDEEKLRTGIGFGYLTGWSIGLILYIFSSTAAEFYDTKGVGDILTVVAIYFFLMPFAGVAEPCLRRDLKFVGLFKSVFVSRLVQFIVTVYLAYHGYSYMSMAWGLVSEKLLFVILINYYRPDYVPLMPSFSKVKEIFVFGGYLSLAGVSKDTRNTFPELLIAKVFTMELAGFYSRAYGAIQIFNKMFTQAILKVVLPHLSKEKRENQDGSYLKVISLFTVFSFPFFMFLIIMAFPIVNILYGDQWDFSIPILRVLCIWSVINSLFIFVPQNLIAHGKVKYLLLQEVFILPLSIIFIYLLSSEGVLYISAGLVLVAVIEFFTSSFLLYKSTGINIIQILSSISKSAFISLFAMLVPLLVLFTMVIDKENLWLPFIVSSLGALIGWIIAVFMFDHDIKKEIIVGYSGIKAKTIKS